MLDAAASTFARQGIDAASLDDVAAAAGFTKGAIYSNFDSKRGLVAALVDDRVSAYLDLGLDAVSDTDLPLVDRARALGDRLTRALDEQRDWHLLFLELWQHAVRERLADDGPRATEGAFVERRRELRSAITMAVAGHADQAGVVLPFPPEQVATLLMALANGLAIERHVEPDTVPHDLLGRVLALVVASDTHSESHPD